LIQSVIAQMYLVPENLNHIKQIASSTDTPEAYWVYKSAIYYYLQQYPEKNKSIKK